MDVIRSLKGLVSDDAARSADFPADKFLQHGELSTSDVDLLSTTGQPSHHRPALLKGHVKDLAKEEVIVLQASNQRNPRIQLVTDAPPEQLGPAVRSDSSPCRSRAGSIDNGPVSPKRGQLTRTDKGYFSLQANSSDVEVVVTPAIIPRQKSSEGVSTIEGMVPKAKEKESPRENEAKSVDRSPARMPALRDWLPKRPSGEGGDGADVSGKSSEGEKRSPGNSAREGERQLSPGSALRKPPTEGSPRGVDDKKISPTNSARSENSSLGEPATSSKGSTRGMPGGPAPARVAPPPASEEQYDYMPPPPRAASVPVPVPAPAAPPVTTAPAAQGSTSEASPPPFGVLRISPLDALTDMHARAGTVYSALPKSPLLVTDPSQFKKVAQANAAAPKSDPTPTLRPEILAWAASANDSYQTVFAPLPVNNHSVGRERSPRREEPPQYVRAQPTLPTRGAAFLAKNARSRSPSPPKRADENTSH